MRSLSLFVVALVGYTRAFTIPSSWMATRAASSTTLAVSHMNKEYTVGSGMTEHEIPVFIENLTPENFQESLEMLEPLLTNECVGDICDDYLMELELKAEELGKVIPQGYAATHH